jgi:ribosomal protein S12 methylthiotransferase accessory factor YcaO
MAHYVIAYSGKGMTPNEAHAAALADIIDYLGGNRFGMLHNQWCAMRDNEGFYPSLEAFELMLSFGGVQGYPARAWYQEIWPYG